MRVIESREKAVVKHENELRAKLEEVEQREQNLGSLDAKAKARLRDLEKSERLPFEDGAFDIVVSSCVIHDLPDYQSAIQEMHRVLVPTGVFILAMMPRYASPDRYRSTSAAISAGVISGGSSVISTRSRTDGSGYAETSTSAIEPDRRHRFDSIGSRHSRTAQPRRRT